MKRFSLHYLKNPFVRKGLLFAFLIVAGILFGDIFTLMTRPAPEAVLAQLHATRLMTRSLEVNGTQMTADVWELPPTASPAALRKASGKALVVGRLVYVFSGDVARAKGHCTYPADFPPLAIDCDYVIDTGTMRSVNGFALTAPDHLMTQLASAAQAAGWTPLGPGVWQKGAEHLFARASETPDGTRIALAIQKGMQ